VEKKTVRIIFLTVGTLHLGKVHLPVSRPAQIICLAGYARGVVLN
jgi:hypothetical protein